MGVECVCLEGSVGPVVAGATFGGITALADRVESIK